MHTTRVLDPAAPFTLQFTVSQMIFALSISISLVLIVATILPVFRIRHWTVRVLDFPRVQLAVALLACLVFQLLWPGPSGTALIWVPLLGCLCWQLFWIWPYSPIHPVEVRRATQAEEDTRPHLRVVISNVLMDNRDASRILEHIAREEPDVFVALESDGWWQEQFDTLAAYPHRIACPLDNFYGMHVYSRLPLHSPVIDYLVEDDVPSMAARVELPDGELVRFHVVHPRPPTPGENMQSTERDVELLLLARDLDGISEPTIVTGDLNDVAWSATTRLFRSRSGLLDPRVGRGMFNSFHAGHWYLRWPLDHTFVSNHFRVHEVKRLGPVGSDHFPVLFHLVLSTPLALDSRPIMDEDDRALEQDTLETTVAQEVNAGENPDVDAGRTSLATPE